MKTSMVSPDIVMVLTVSCMIHSSFSKIKMRGNKMLLHPAAPRGWIDWVVRSSFPALDLLSYLCQSEGVASLKDNLAEKQKKAQYARWWGYCAWKNSYSSVEAAAWGIRRGILKTIANTVYSIYFRKSILYIVHSFQFHSFTNKKSRILRCLIPSRLISSSSIVTTYLGKLSLML